MSKAGLLMYERLARGGAGLIITGHMVAADGGDAHANQTRIDNDQYLNALKEITEAAHKNGTGCRIFAQLSHAGPNGIIDPNAEHVALNIPVLLTGGNRSIELLEQIMIKGRVQFFGFVRPLICEPDLPTRWLEGQGSPGVACISCNDCLQTLIKAPPTHCVRV